jgi:exosome complex component RRP42
MIKISSSERQYIAEGVAANVRADGRARLAYRSVAIETSLLSQSNGSARVSLAGAGTDVLASVKLEVATPSPQAPRDGLVSIAVACSPSVSAKLSSRATEELNVELSQLLTRLLCSCPSVDLAQLCLVPGESVWAVHVDVTVFESTGNLPDLMSMAVYAALNDTVFPSVRLVGVEGEDKTIEVDADPAAGKRLTGIPDWPLCVTMCKLGAHYVVDPSQEEELCVGAQLCVAVDPTGRVCGVQKRGAGALAPKEMQQMVDEAAERAKELFRALQAALHVQQQRDEALGRKHERVGFLG